MLMIDFIGREMIGKLRKQAATEMKRSRIISRFVIRRAKKVNGRLDNLEFASGSHMGELGSIGRSLQTCRKLFEVVLKRTDMIGDKLNDWGDYCADLWEDLRRAEKKIKAIEGDMDDNSTDCAAIWERLRLQEILIDNMQDKVHALEKLHTTKIAQFIFSPPPTPDQEQMVECKGNCEKS